MSMLHEIIDYIQNDPIHEGYGAKDFSLYLYSLIKMLKPSSVVELGTGFGTTSYLSAQALKENNYGKLTTIDDGSQHEFVDEYFSSIDNKIKDFELEHWIDFRKHAVSWHLDELSDIDHVDILFNDIDCDELHLYSSLLYLLFRTKDESYLFLDGGADFPFFTSSELLVECLNRGVIPKKMYEIVSEQDHSALENVIKKHNFYFDFVKKNVKVHHQCTFVIIHIYRKNKIPNSGI